MTYIDTCCCGCSLRTGTIIIGVLSLIGHIGACIKNIIVTSDNLYPLRNIYLSYYSVECVASIVICVLLLVGSIKGKKWAIIPWIAFSPWRCTQQLFGLLVNVIHYCDSRPAWMSFFAVVFLLLIFVLNVYFSVIVVNYHDELSKFGANPATNPGVIYSAPNPGVQVHTNNI